VVSSTLAQTEDLTGVYGYSEDATNRKVGNALSTHQKAALTQTIEYIAGATKDAWKDKATFSDWAIGDAGGVQTSWKVTATTKEADSARLSNSLDPAQLKKDMDKLAAAYFAAAPTPNTLGNTQSAKINSRPSSSTAQGFVIGTATVDFGQDAAALITNKKALIVACLAARFVKFAVTEEGLTEIALDATPAGNKVGFTFNSTRLSAPQEEGVRSHLTYNKEKFMAEAVTCDASIGADKWTFTLGSVTVTKSNLYSPPFYEPTSDTKNLNGVARLQGNNEFPAKLNLTDALNWIIGIAIISAVCIVCAMCQLSFIPCCYCCVGPVKKREELDTTFNKFFITAVVFVSLCMIGFFVGVAGEDKLGAGMVAFQNAFGKTLDVVNGVGSALDGLTEGINEIDTALAPHKGKCTLADEFSSSLASFKVTNPMPTNINKTLDDFNKLVANSEGTRSSAVLAFLLVGPVFGISFFLYILFMQIKFRKCDKCCNCCMCLAVPFSFLYFFVCWFLAGILAFFAIFFSDMCIKDPLEALFGLASLGGDMKFFFQCTSPAPSLASLVYNMGRSLEDSVSHINGLESYLQRDKSQPDCSKLPFDSLKTGFTKIGKIGPAAAELVRCKPYNSILTDIFYDGICINVTSGFAYLVLAFGFMSAFSLCLMCLYRKLRKTAMQVVPDFDSQEYEELNPNQPQQQIPLAEPVPMQTYESSNKLPPI
jgi:hypothetical protein